MSTNFNNLFILSRRQNLSNLLNYYNFVPVFYILTFFPLPTRTHINMSVLYYVITIPPVEASRGKLISKLKRKVVIFLVGQNHKDNTHQLIVEDNFSFSLVFGYSFNGNLQIQRLYLSFLQATFIFAIFMFLLMSSSVRLE